MAQREQRRGEAFCNGCRISLFGHACTWLMTRLADDFWHVLGHVTVGLAAYLVERLFHS